MKSLAIIAPTLNNGGAERIISTLSWQLKGRYNIKIITFDYSKQDYKFGCEIIDLSEKYSKELNRIKPIKFINAIKIINKIKKEMNFDIVLSFMENMGIINALTKKNETAVHAVSSYLTGQYKYSKKNIFRNLYLYTFRLLIKVFFNKLDGILTLSEESSEDLIQNFKIEKRKVIVTYNPYDISMIKEMAEEKSNTSNKRIRIVNMGSLIDVKSQWNLIRSFNKLRDENYDIELMIIGRGSNEKYLKELVNEYKLEDYVIFQDYTTNPFKYLKNSDIYVLTSLREGLPNAVIEAMACGLPIISTDCSSGPREILAPDTNFLKKAKGIEKVSYGILVPVNDGVKKNFKVQLNWQEQLLTEAIKMLINDEKLRREYKLKSMQRCMDFDVTIIMQRWIKAINNFDLNNKKY